MDTGTLIIAAVIIAIIVLPFVLILQSTKSQSSKLIKGLRDLASQNNGTLSKTNTYGKFALSLDQATNTIYFFRKTSETESSNIINLNDVVSCAISKQTRRVKTEKEFHDAVSVVALVFQMKNKQTIQQLELYDENESFQLNGELAIADEWKKLIDAQLAKQPLATIPNNTKKSVFDLSRAAAF